LFGPFALSTKRKGMKFQRDMYLSEMTRLIHDAVAELSSKHPDLTIYTVSIWTDPDAAASAISFDSRENSQRAVAKHEQWAADTRRGLLEEGRLEEAAAFETYDGRNCNPADFLLSSLVEVRHKSFGGRWAEKSGGRCWDELGPCLAEVVQMAKVAFAQLRLEPDAELAVNSLRDWYDHPVALAPGAGPN
jgi:hypothetical protein